MFPKSVNFSTVSPAIYWNTFRKPQVIGKLSDSQKTTNADNDGAKIQRSAGNRRARRDIRHDAASFSDTREVVSCSGIRICPLPLSWKKYSAGRRSPAKKMKKRRKIHNFHQLPKSLEHKKRSRREDFTSSSDFLI